MKTTQPSIANDEELAGYRAGAEQLRRMMERHEDDLAAEWQKAPADLQRMDQIRYQLHHLYGYYRGIQDAIDAYLRPLPSPRRGTLRPSACQALAHPGANSFAGPLAAAKAYGASGRHSEKIEPPPRAELTPTRPPCISISALLRYNPSPSPIPDPLCTDTRSLR